MPARPLLILALSALIIAPLLALPPPASACGPGYCEGLSSLAIQHTTPIPPDGVLVLRATRPAFSYPDDSELASITVTVTAPGGVVVDGALEYGQDRDTTLLWRPALPFTPLTVYDAAIKVEQGGSAELCGNPALIEVNGQVEVGDAPLGGPFVPTISAEADLEITPSYQFEDIVCCDGGAPFIGACSVSEWGRCASIRGRHEILATFTADLAALAAAGDQIALLGFDLRTGVTRRTSTTEAPCVVPTAIVHATGETITGAPVCAGEALVAELGPVDLDANPALATCKEPPQNCATSSSQWNEAACEPWDDWQPLPADDPDPAEDAGCGCRSYDGGGAGALLLGLVAAARSRRRQGSSIAP